MSLRKHIVTLAPRAPHESALAPSCVVGVGAIGRALCARLLEEDDDTLAVLDGLRSTQTDAGERGTAAPFVLLRGPAARLPWVDGALYLGEIVPGFHVPTTSTLTAPAALVRDAFARSLPLALVPLSSSFIARVSLRAVLPVSRDLLAVLARGGA